MQEDEQARIYCANCLHCKITTINDVDGGGKLLKVRCAAGMWKKKIGEEKLYRYDTVEQRRLSSCTSYDEMGEPEIFLRDLRKSLISKDLYGADIIKDDSVTVVE